ncbi:MAG: sugar ABC transporter permease [Lachnospiraceae bacterium]|nr:sugar ABC transporter permease [Lachnospiraceae bacterium]
MTKKKRISKRIIKENLQLSTLMLPVVILLGVFAYFPMFGIIIAFKDYKVPRGIFGSNWVDPLFKNFEFFLKSQDAFRVTRNTILLNFLFIIVSTICGVIFAILMYEVKKATHVKIYQTVSILPSFLSWVAVSYIVYGFLDGEKGILNQIVRAFGGENIAWYTTAGYWPTILSIVVVWHGVGLKSIMYYASLMGIDDALFEAAEVDGASKFQRIIHISLPHLIPIVTIMAILDVGKIFRADFGLFYNVTRNVGELYPTTDVIDTYVFRALMQNGNISMSSAASFIQSIVCFITLVTVNAIVKKVSPENSLF